MGSNRYALVTYDGKVGNIPKITIPKRDTDLKITYNSDKTRLHRIAGEIYGDDTYGWLILLANPEYYDEYEIPKNAILRVPFPRRDAEADYEKQVLLNKDK